MHIRNLIKHYNFNGFLKLPGFYNETETRSILKQSNNCLNDKNIQVIRESDNVTIRSIMHYHHYNEILSQFSRDSRIIDIVERLTGSPVYISQSKINLKRGKKGKKWDYHRGFTFWHFLDGKPEPNMVSVFICLSDQTIENGAVYVLKESHKKTTLELLKNESVVQNRNHHVEDTSSQLSIQIRKGFIEKYEKEYQKEYLLGKAGDVFFMHPNLLHASDKNIASNSRDLMITVYNSIDNLPTKYSRPDYLCEPYTGALKPYQL